MGRVNHSIMLKYAETPELNPYIMGGRASFALLEELMLTASIIGRS